MSIGSKTTISSLIMHHLLMYIVMAIILALAVQINAQDQCFTTNLDVQADSYVLFQRGADHSDPFNIQDRNFGGMYVSVLFLYCIASMYSDSVDYNIFF